MDAGYASTVCSGTVTRTHAVRALLNNLPVLNQSNDGKDPDQWVYILKVRENPSMQWVYGAVRFSHHIWTAGASFFGDNCGE